MNIAVLLSGCGIGDGSQIEEVVAIYISLDKIGATYTPVALDAEQKRTINHVTEQADCSARSILVESARIGRGRIVSLSDTSPDAFDALIIPGGIGLLANYTNMLSQDKPVVVDDCVKDFIMGFVTLSKPVGVMCSAIQLIRLLFEGEGGNVTLFGTKQQIGTSERIDYVNCPATGIIIDNANNIISTPAFIESQNLYYISTGIDKLVGEIFNRISV